MNKWSSSWLSLTRIKKKQFIHLSVLIGLIFLMSWGIFSLLIDHTSATQSQADKNTLINMTNPLTHVDESSIWVERTQNTLNKTLKTTESLQEQLAQLNQAKMAAEKSNQFQNQQVEALQHQLQTLEKKWQAPATPSFPAAGTTQNLMPPNIPGIHEDTFKLSPQPTTLITPTSPLQTPDTYVPAGTFVRAVMIGGADAAAGITSQGSPTPGQSHQNSL